MSSGNGSAPRVAVIAHAGKTLGGGLPELRRVLSERLGEEPRWIEVPKSKKAPRQVERVLEEGADLVFAWGGDGMVQRCIDALGGGDAALAIIPAGTANLFATSLGIPRDIEQAVDIGLSGTRRRLDVGRFNGERFAVMAGAGFDAAMIKDSSAMKDRIGRAAYVLSGARNLGGRPFEAKIEVDGVEWYDGPASCVLFGNVGDVFGGVQVFPDARPDDGTLDLGIVTAEGAKQWLRTMARAAAGDPQRSPFVRITRVRNAKVKLDRKVLYELDGGDREKVKSFKVEVEPDCIEVCVPSTSQEDRA